MGISSAFPPRGATLALPKRLVLWFVEPRSFRNTKRGLIVREKAARMPADLGGIIYISIEKPKQWKSAADEIVDAVRHMVYGDGD